jgi:thiol:disulfide interchange protein DsbD
MCCGRDCNPGFTDLSVTLPVDAHPAPSDMRWQRFFEKARADMPTPLDGFGATATATRKDGVVTLRVTPQAPEGASAPATDGSTTADRSNLFQRIFGSTRPQAQAPGDAPARPQDSPVGIFFTEDGYINADKNQVFRQDGDSLVIELIVSSYYTDAPPKELQGILWLKDGSLGKGAIIRAPFAK